MINKIIWIIGIVWIGNIQNGVQAQRRNFIHPGITYTQGDLDRMKAMVKAKHEPYYSTFLKLKESPYSSLNTQVINRGKQIREGRFNATIGVDGRRAHDLALLWHLTGDEAYARKAVEYLNANSYYTNTSSRGTGPLDNGKIYLLIDAAASNVLKICWSILDIAIRKISLPNMQITGMIQRTELHSIGIFLISMPQGLVIKDFSLLVE